MPLTGERYWRRSEVRAAATQSPCTPGMSLAVIPAITVTRRIDLSSSAARVRYRGWCCSSTRASSAPASSGVAGVTQARPHHAHCDCCRAAWRWMRPHLRGRVRRTRGHHLAEARAGCLPLPRHRLSRPCPPKGDAGSACTSALCGEITCHTSSLTRSMASDIRSLRNFKPLSRMIL